MQLSQTTALAHLPYPATDKMALQLIAQSKQAHMALRYTGVSKGLRAHSVYSTPLSAWTANSSIGNTLKVAFSAIYCCRTASAVQIDTSSR